MIRTILVPLDGSPHANAALDFASILARDHGADLVLLHIGFRGGELPAELHARAERAYDEAERAGTLPSGHRDWSREHRVLEFMGRMILDDARAVAAGRDVPEIRSELDWGDPGERIVHWAKAVGADLIVIGSRGYSQLEGLMLGSVSHKVLSVAPCTCATVRHGGAEGGFDGVRRMLVATDGSEHGDKAVAFASEIAVKSGADLKILHLLLYGLRPEQIRRAAGDAPLSDAALADLDPAYAGVNRFALYVTRVSRETLVEVGERVLERARQVADRVGVTEVETLLEDGDPAARILEHVDRDELDLVVMGTRGLGEIEGLIRGSVSNKVTHLALCSVISVR